MLVGFLCVQSPPGYVPQSIYLSQSSTASGLKGYESQCNNGLKSLKNGNALVASFGTADVHGHVHCPLNGSSTGFRQRTLTDFQHDASTILSIDTRRRRPICISNKKYIRDIS